MIQCYVLKHMGYSPGKYVTGFWIHLEEDLASCSEVVETTKRFSHSKRSWLLCTVTRQVSLAS